MDTRGGNFMFDEPKPVQHSAMAEHPSPAVADPRTDRANQLMREVYGELLGCTRRHVRNQDDAEELSQAMVAELWISHGEDMLWYDDEAFKASLPDVVRRRVIALRRRARRRRAFEAAYQE